MEGSACVTGTLTVNDVSGGVITVTGNLTQTKAATVIPPTRANGTRIITENPYLADNTVTFTVPDTYINCVWKIDGKAVQNNVPYTGITISSDNRTLTCDISSWDAGSYDIFLSAEKNERKYSYQIQLTK